ncbi:unnamed protein product [Auanema sp. JU1783]|nr:unnamed protein product [Auanema sp. JU1783]
MDEDNAHDIYKYICKNVSENDENVSVTYKSKTFSAKLYIHGNILCCNATHEAQEPLIFVLEGATVRKDETDNTTLVLAFADAQENTRLQFSGDEALEKWIVQIATCSHQMLRAELDELAYKFYTMSTQNDPSPESPSTFHSFYLANPYRFTHNFAISQQNSLPARRIVVEESLWESKLSTLLPTEMIKSYRKWNTEFAYLLESRQRSWPHYAIPALHEVLREVRETGETFEQCYEFMNTYSGPSFRKSTEKHRIAFANVPTNLHLQSFGLSNTAHKEILTCGTASAVPLRFHNGGLSRLCTALEVDPNYHDYAFWSKRQTILSLKKNIGELSHRLETEWKIADFGKPDKVCLEMSAGIKQVYEGLKDSVAWSSSIEECADILLEEDRRRADLGIKTENRVPDSLRNQIDTIDAMLISLNTKIAVIDTLDDAQAERRSYEKSAREALSNCLDLLLIFADSLLEAQFFGLVLSLSKPAVAHNYFHIQLRSDFVLSQVATIAATAILSRINCGWLTNGGVAADLLLCVFSFLSAYGDERGMAEDAWEAWKILFARAEFILVRAPSTVCRNCIPMISGSRNNIKISIPLPHDTYDNLPQELKNKSSIKVEACFFNTGVNHEATLGQSFGGIAFETAINQEGAERLNNYANRVDCSTTARELVGQLVTAVAQEPSRKNLQIFEYGSAACDALNGVSVLCCKSGKDRTGMAATLAQGWTLQQTCGLNASQVNEVVVSLRKDGVRRENCRKNVGKNIYSFSPFQMHFLPKAFRPPTGTYAQGVAS